MIQKVFSEELTRTLYTVADDVKCQIEFNPAKVAAYRQIGYENRALADSDFQDDTKDAGEVGAGQTITVLYELTLADAGSGEGGGLKYQTSEPTEAGLGDEFLTLGIRYKEPGESESRLEEYPLDSSILTETPGDDFTLAAAVAELCMVLRGSPYTGDAGITDVREMLLGIDLNDVYKEELLYLVTQLR